jgi:thiamine-monophosphate kinase
VFRLSNRTAPPNTSELQLLTSEPEPEPTISPLGETSQEHRIISRALAAAHLGRVALDVPPGDDAAVLADGTALTVDLLVEGVHFTEHTTASDVGYKAVAVSVSDCAAMGARPTWMLLGLATRGDDLWTRQLLEGVGQAAQAFDVDLIGGDTTGTTGPRCISITMAATCERPVRRDTGSPGDVILVTGVPGLAGAGYLLEHPGKVALAALHRPTPRLAFMLDARPWVTSAMDLSDGLATDLPRLATASGCGARVDPSSLPDHPELHGAGPDRRTLQLAAGDDYELLITASAEHVPHLNDIAAKHTLELSAIGHLTDDADARCVDGPWPASPWSHHQVSVS